MSRVDELRAAREGYSVAFLAFLKGFSESGTFLTCFFEGKDLKYYGPRLTMLNPGLHYRSIACGGRKAVLKVRELIMTSEAYRDANVAFFVDHDYGLNPLPDGSTNIYETPCYSVENFYVSISVFQRVLESEFGLARQSEGEPFFEQCIRAYEERLLEYLNGVEGLNAWVLAHRKREIADQSARKLDADCFKLNGFFDVSLEAIKVTYTTFDLQTESGCSYCPSNEEMEALRAAFHKESRQKCFRGKFLSYFVRTFLNRLADDSVKDSPSYFPSRRKGCLRPTERNFLSELSQYADTPECLRNFIIGQVSTRPPSHTS